MVNEDITMIVTLEMECIAFPGGRLYHPIVHSCSRTIYIDIVYCWPGCYAKNNICRCISIILIRCLVAENLISTFGGAVVSHAALACARPFTQRLYGCLPLLQRLNGLHTTTQIWRGYKYYWETRYLSLSSIKYGISSVGSARARNRVEHGQNGIGGDWLGLLCVCVWRWTHGYAFSAK